MTPVTTDGLRLRFEGEAVSDGSMSLADLTPALIAIGSLMADGRRDLFPTSEPIDTRVRATEPGSFLIEFAMVQSQQIAEGLDGTIDMLNSDGVSALKNLLMLLFGSTGLAGFLTYLKNRKPTNAADADDGNVIIELADGDRITIPVGTWEAYNSHAIRESMERLASPVDSPGIDTLEIESDDGTTTVVDESAVKYFRAPRPQSDLETEEVYEDFLRIHTVRRESARWWFRNTRGEIVRATVADDAFLSAWANNDEFIGGNDVLLCRILLEQWLEPNGSLRTDYTVLRVLDHHREPPSRAALPLDEPD